MSSKRKRPYDPTNPDRKYPSSDELSQPDYGFDVHADPESGELHLSEWRPLAKPHLMDGFTQTAIFAMLQMHPAQRAAVMAKYCYHCGDDLDQLEHGLCHCTDKQRT